MEPAGVVEDGGRLSLREICRQHDPATAPTKRYRARVATPG